MQCSTANKKGMIMILMTLAKDPSGEIQAYYMDRRIEALVPAALWDAAWAAKTADEAAKVPSADVLQAAEAALYDNAE
jgi:hypothetical protein